MIEGSGSGLARSILDSSGKDIRNIICGFLIDIDLGHLLAGNYLNIRCVGCPCDVILNTVHGNDRYNFVVGSGDLGVLLIHCKKISLGLFNVTG